MGFELIEFGYEEYFRQLEYLYIFIEDAKLHGNHFRFILGDTTQERVVKVLDYLTNMVHPV